MKTTRCILSWPDGRKLTAEVSTETWLEAGKVRYTGARELAPTRPEEMPNGILRVWCENLARKTGASLEVSETGEWPAIFRED